MAKLLKAFCSKKEPLMRLLDEQKISLKFRYCMVYSEELLIHYPRRRQRDIRLFKDFESKMTRVIDALNERPVFIDQQKNDYRLKDLSAVVAAP